MADVTRKVAFLTPLYFDEASCIGGGERYATNMAVGLVEASQGAYEVELISYGVTSAFRELRPGVSLRVLPVAKRPSDPLDAVSWELPSAIADADLVHVHMAFSRSGEFGLLAARQQRKPTCASDHGGHSSWLGASLGTLELADRIVAYSSFGASLFRTPTPVVVIRGGVDAERFAPPEPRPTRDRVLYVGRLLAHKGIDQLIRALPPELPLTVCGRPYDPHYYSMLQQLASGKDVTFVTDADDAEVRNLYAKAWCNVLPSVYVDCYGRRYRAPELMGLTLLEAMSCETVPIASRVAAMPEFIQPYQSGYLFDHPDELTSLLRRLAQEPETVERVGQEARRQVLRAFDLRVAGAKLALLYDESDRGIPDKREDRDMKILVLSNFYPPEVVGGYELACAQAVEALRRLGHEVLVLTAAGRGFVEPQDGVRRIFSLTDIWNQYAMAKRPAAVQRLMDVQSRLINTFNVQMLSECVSTFQPDVAYVHNLTGLGGLGLMAALKHLGVPWVWQLGDSVPSYCCSVWGKVVPALGERFGAELQGTFIAVSSRLVEEIEGLGVPLNGRVEILPYWFDGEPKAIPDRSVRNGPLRVVSAGRLTPYKGVDVLIEAAGIIKRSRWSVEIDFIGAVADVDENYYPALVQRHDVEDRVRFLGPMDHRSLIARYPDYEAFAFPTWEREPFGIGPIEAAAHGGCLPIIAQSCGLAEWLVHGVHCLKVAPTAEELARVFLDLLEWRIDARAIAELRQRINLARFPYQFNRSSHRSTPRRCRSVGTEDYTRFAGRGRSPCEAR